MMTMMCVDVQNVYKVKKRGAIGRKTNAHHIGLWYQHSSFLQAIGGSH
jgi:hypothetical protein